MGACCNKDSEPHLNANGDIVGIVDRLDGHVQLKREQRAEYTYKSGAKYTGEWVGELRDGHGVQVWPDGGRYEGQFREDKAEAMASSFTMMVMCTKGTGRMTKPMELGCTCT